MIKLMVELFWQKEQLASESFTRIQFWTETTGDCLVGLQDQTGTTLLDISVWLEGLHDGKSSELIEKGKMGL